MPNRFRINMGSPIRRVIVAALAVCLIQLPASESFASGSTSTTVPSGSSTQPGAKKNVVTFGTQTATAGGTDARGYYAFGATAGGRLTDHVAVINYSDQPVTLLVRSVDAVNTPQGGFAAVPINKPSKEVGTWIFVPSSDESVNLPPRSDIIVPFQVQVPKDATPGDHFGVITATLVSAAISKSGQHIQLFQTVGSRVFIRVSGPLHPAIAIENLRVRYSGTLNPVGTGRARLSYTVHNTGNVALGGKQVVYVTGLFGSKRVAVSVPQIQLLLPHFSVKQSVTVTGIFPEIRDNGHVSISPLYIAGTVNPASGPFKSNVGFWAVPWTLLGVIALAIVMLIVWFMRRRRRRDRVGPGRGSETPSGPTIAESLPNTRGLAVPDEFEEIEPPRDPVKVPGPSSSTNGGEHEQPESTGSSGSNGSALKSSEAEDLRE